MDNNDELLKSYQQAVGVGVDVDKLQESIDSLVRSMGLELPNGDGQAGDAQAVNGNAGGKADQNQGGDTSGGYGMDSSTFAGGGGMEDDFDVDQFLNSLSKDNE